MSRATTLALLAVGIAACNAPSKTTAPPSNDAAHGIVGSAATVATTANHAPEAVKIVEASDDVDALTLIRTRRLEAKAESRVLVVYVGATWCEPCTRFKSELRSGRLDARLAKVTLLAFDADRDGDRLAGAGYRYAFVPFVALPGGDGQPVDAQQAAGKGGEAWRELLAKLDAWQAI